VAWAELFAKPRAYHGDPPSRLSQTLKPGYAYCAAASFFCAKPSFEKWSPIFGSDIRLADGGTRHVYN